MGWIRNYLISKFLIDGFKVIEKQDFLLKALEICFKNDTVKGVWQKFLNSVDGLLDDAKDEVQQARKWK